MKENKRKNIAIIFGGCSSEYSVSLESASGVLSALDRSAYQPVMIGITKAGKWFRYDGSIEAIAADTWEKEHCVPACVCPNRGSEELWVFSETGMEHIHIDAAFPILHGRNGEDGTIQGLFELAGIPLVGCGTLASALCMDKDRAHKLVSLTGIRIPQSIVIEQDYDTHNVLEQAEKLGFPVFVKPVKAGSSFGITKVMTAKALTEAIQNAFYYDDRVIVEESILGFEVGCAVMGDAELITGVPDEIEICGDFFDFFEKYNLKTSKIHVPARVSEAKLEEIQAAAKTVYRALDCSGFARVDLFLTPSGELVFNEVNTIPGFTAHSRFPSMMQQAGIPFPEVISRIVSAALE